MPDFVYLLENRLNAHQLSALKAVREAAREARMPVFLVGDAVRDLICGNSVRELEVVLHGNTADLRKPLVANGAAVWWESAASRRISLRFPGSVLLELTTARHTDYPKCGKPVYSWASIHEDLRSRDFTVNAMAISLNDGSFGLLMDPLNGVADLEMRQLRLVSNYGFLEEPARLVRASRLTVRLGFSLEERTLRRFENAREESIIASLSEEERRRELEQILHEEEALKVMASHEAQGWMKALFPAWTTAKVDTEKLHALHDFSVELQMQGVHADLSAAQAHYLTSKLSAKDLSTLKENLLRPGFVKAWEGLEASAAQLAKSLAAKENARPSACYSLLTSFAPEAVVWLGFTARLASVKDKYEAFLKTWPESRQKLPVALMAEMRITPELPEYASLVHKIFLRLIDGELQSEDELRAFLEPFSPPAPPPPVSIKRSRSRKVAEIRVKSRVADDTDEDSEDVSEEIEEDGIELDFRIGDSDEGRILGDDDDDNDDDVFARDSVGGEEDQDNDAEDDEDDEAAKPGRSSVGPPSRSKKPASTDKPVKAMEKATASAPKRPATADTSEKPASKTAPARTLAAKSPAPGKSGKGAVMPPVKPTTSAAISRPASKPASKAGNNAASKAAKTSPKPVPKAKPAPKASARKSVSRSVASKPSGKPAAKQATSKPKVAPKAKPAKPAPKASAKPQAAKSKPVKAANHAPGKKKR